MTSELTTLPASRKTELFRKLTVLRKKFVDAGDEANAAKLASLARKVEQSEFAFGFCGHFSAGKSTMINHLTGEDLLPSSPIPTSANLVKVCARDSAYARVFFHDETAVQFAYPYDVDQLHNYARDNDIHSIEISHPIDRLPTGTAVLDTPGVDSTDDAHRISTESALHLADVIFYVTDYNHVLSEVNFAFWQQLKALNKRTVLVVNQIDKHQDGELPFSAYRQTIETALQERELGFEHIFYTSLGALDHPENEISRLREYIDGFAGSREALLIENAETEARRLIEEHAEALLDSNKSDSEHADDSASAQAEWEALHAKIDTLENHPDTFFEEAQKELKKTIQSAILMPYETREAGRAYLESAQADFKVGLFGAKKKTEQAREQRLTLFFEKVSAAVETLDWQVKEGLAKLARSFDIRDEAFSAAIYDIKVTLEPRLLKEQIEPGATFNDRYVLNYSEKVAEAIQRLYLRAVNEKLEEGRRLLQVQAQPELEALRVRLSALDAQVEQSRRRRALEQEAETRRTEWLSVLSGEVDEAAAREALAALPDREIREAEARAPREPAPTPPPRGGGRVEAKDAPVPAAAGGAAAFRERRLQAAAVLERAAAAAGAVRGLGGAAAEMRSRAERLECNRFTVALFGAFSAGKSSFANALIGESVLPVSPNPTTAAINKISPVDETHRHGTARIQLKAEADLLADVRRALKPFALTVNGLNELPQALAGIDDHNRSGDRVRQLSFLLAVAQGLREFGDELGKEQLVDLREFHERVANEEKACMVESIELYYDCPLTRQGITLVDTPGADSINARHTGVAFDYIKNADAVLFVTYYNHAFSRADREFLIQLGRVKDSFAMDKMFFVVNAADLASSDEELRTVVDYIESNLLTHGIRHPRIYPVSSKLAIKEKTDHPAGDSGIAAFEHDFFRFSMGELTNVAIKEAAGDVRRAMETVNAYLSASREDESVRAQKREQAEASRREVLQIIKDSEAKAALQSIEQEISQLIHYVNERVFLRYHDMFKESFSPAALSDLTENKKQAVMDGVAELIERIGFDLAQEMRATALRIEAFSTKALKTVGAKITEETERRTGKAFLPEAESPEYRTPKFENELETLDLTSYQDLAGYFKNTKQFFEKEGRRKLHDELQGRLQAPVSGYLSMSETTLKETYPTQFAAAVEALKDRLSSRTNEHFEGELAVLSTDVDPQELENRKNELSNLLQQLASF